MEREKKSLRDRLRSLEKQSRSEPDTAKRRMDEVIKKFNGDLEEKGKEKAGVIKIAQLKKVKVKVEAVGQEWKAEMERLTAEMGELQRATEAIEYSRRSYLDSRLLELQEPRTSTTLSFWETLCIFDPIRRLLLGLFSRRGVWERFTNRLIRHNSFSL
ncbi:hypothetical protein CORC01_08982 [Colletotrichum orchidophilum]|uniref:Uncharacterized protein n=1 Tax=Colletotrichum orchidophilum TaxID=1209926 RepID=A0A1G4B2P7_9PEZI|nr:uncharacterized protein CORC01_08982 [Colletotrichum orchidophilum]OHE95698.1 hypothetical protein CORC01_08982 [Colletotrichum orchidophilum]